MSPAQYMKILVRRRARLISAEAAAQAAMNAPDRALRSGRIAACAWAYEGYQRATVRYVEAAERRAAQKGGAA